uniref:Uncharacterized protein n=1 Tax=Romanomermis culicivorax TaxID=13658 RepID=A0A915KJF6_ROMCU
MGTGTPSTSEKTKNAVEDHSKTAPNSPKIAKSNVVKKFKLMPLMYEISDDDKDDRTTVKRPAQRSVPISNKMDNSKKIMPTTPKSTNVADQPKSMKKIAVGRQSSTDSKSWSTTYTGKTKNKVSKTVLNTRRAPAKLRTTGRLTVAQRRGAVENHIWFRRIILKLKGLAWISAAIVFQVYSIGVLAFILSQGHERPIDKCRVFRCQSFPVSYVRLKDQATGGIFAMWKTAPDSREYYSEIALDENKVCWKRAHVNGSLTISKRGFCRFDECVVPLSNVDDEQNASTISSNIEQDFKFYLHGRMFGQSMFKYYCMKRETARDLRILSRNAPSSNGCPSDEKSCQDSTSFYVERTLCARATKSIKDEIVVNNCWKDFTLNHSTSILNILQNRPIEPNILPPILTFTCSTCRAIWNASKLSINCLNRTTFMDMHQPCQVSPPIKNLLSTDGKPCCIGDAIGRCYKTLCLPDLG